MAKQQIGKKVLAGTFIHCKDRQNLEYMHDAAVAVDETGKIAAVERSGGEAGVKEGVTVAAAARALQKLGWEEGEVEVHEARPGQFFFPGFIDSHVHASQYPNVGVFGKKSLLDWLETYTFPMEASLTDPKRAERVYRACVDRTLAHGTTTASYYATRDVATTNTLAQTCFDKGQRALVGRVCMDNRDVCPDFYCDESAEAGLGAARDSIAGIRKIDPSGQLVSPILTPRFAPSCSGESMMGLAAMQRETGLPVQTHVSENEGEIALVAKLFPESSSYTDVYDSHGLLTPKTILAHAVHLTDAEADLVAARGAKVSHCACSNSSLTSGVARVRWMWDKGIEVGLGTDMSGGYSPSILEAARQAALASRHVAMGSGREGDKLTVEEVLYLATRGGARCVGMEDKVGGFEVGKEWDAQLVGLHSVREAGEEEEEEEVGGDDNVDVFGWETWEERIAKWLFNGDDRNTKCVWVRGRMVRSRK